MIPYGRQHIDQSDIDAVIGVLRSEYLTQGPRVPEFEEAVCRYVDAPFGVAVNSATSALHVACMALDLGPGDTLWTSSNTFLASANCGRFCGAGVEFLDIDERTYNLSVPALTVKLEQAAMTGRLPKVVVPVHFGGQSCEMQSIGELAQRYGFRVIEDASHAIGGSYKTKPVGCCEYSDITVFSFHPVKIITTTEGGMAVTRSETLAERMRLARSHGMTRRPDLMDGPSDGPWYYQQIALGYNYRMTEIQAALGLSQLGSIDQFVARRHELASRYDMQLADLKLRIPYRCPQSRSALHLYPILLQDTRRRRGVFDGLRQANILVNVHYIPVHLQPYYRQLGSKPGDCPQAEKYYAGAISLPLYYDLRESEQDHVIETLRRLLRELE